MNQTPSSTAGNVSTTDTDFQVANSGPPMPRPATSSPKEDFTVSGVKGLAKVNVSQAEFPRAKSLGGSVAESEVVKGGEEFRVQIDWRHFEFWC